MNKQLAITPGEPAGIGPDIVLQLAAKKSLANSVIFADKRLLQKRAEALHLNIELHDYDFALASNSKHDNAAKGKLDIVHIPLTEVCIPGILNANNSAYVIQTIRSATEACLSGKLKALVTGPVHKAIINEAGIPFSGHTEFLAKLSHAPRTVMMLANPHCRIALVTTHMALRQVPDAITAENLQSCIAILDHDLKKFFKLKHPKIGVCALNPHAGENGHLGTEEIDVIIPTLNRLQQQGYNLIGPLSADTAFTPEQLAQVDVILCLYHDQGLPVIKAQGFGETVNITLGLNFVRTSVDHGTALTLAGTGKASEQSLEAAITMASKLINL